MFVRQSSKAQHNMSWCIIIIYLISSDCGLIIWFIINTSDDALAVTQSESVQVCVLQKDSLCVRKCGKCGEADTNN